MRSLMRLLVAFIIGIVALLAIALTTHALPAWAEPALTLSTVPATYAVLPGARRGFIVLALHTLRPRWAERWEEAGVPFGRLGLMIGSPLPPAQYATYDQALSDDQSARLDGAPDPRLIWWLHAQHITPERLIRYRNLGVSAAALAILIHAGITEEDWRTLLDHNLTRPSDTVLDAPAAERYVEVLTWFRTSHATLHPDQFHTPQAPRTVPQAAAAMSAWARHTGTSPFDHTYRGSPNLDTIRHAFVFTGATLDQWATIAGTLAPHFIAAQMSPEQAAEALAAGPAPTPEQLDTLAALLNHD